MDQPPNAEDVKTAAAKFLSESYPAAAITDPASSAPRNEGEGGKPAPNPSLGFTTQVIEEIKKDAVREANAKLDFAATASITIASFGLLLIGIIALLGYKNTIQPSKLIALSLIVIAALLLIVLGYSDEQMSPVIGLLGTVAGYMLGSKEWNSDTQG